MPQCLTYGMARDKLYCRTVVLKPARAGFLLGGHMRRKSGLSPALFIASGFMGGLAVPDAPALTAPANAAVLDDTTPEFSWQAVPGAVTYDIEIRATLTGTPTATSITGTTYTPGVDLSNFTLYSWRVRAVNAGGVAGAWSAARTFTPKVYLFRDEFASGSWPSGSGTRTSDVGTLTVVDGSTRLSMTGGEVVPNGATVGTNSPGIYQNTAHARAAGLALKATVKRVSAYGSSVNKLFSPCVVWNFSAGGFDLAQMYGITFTATGTFAVLAADTSSLGVLAIGTSDTYYEFGVILRDTGFIAVVDGKIVGVSAFGTQSNLYPNVSSLSSDRHPPAAARMAVGALGGVWAADTIYTSKITTPAAANTFTHTANGIVDFIVTTLPVSGSMQVAFRWQDDNNHWRINIDSAGAVALQEVVAGTPTNRATTTCTAGDHIAVLFSGSASRLWRERSGGMVSIAGTAGSSFLTLTAGKVLSLGTGGAISNLYAWPESLAGDALAIYNAL